MRYGSDSSGVETKNSEAMIGWIIFAIVAVCVLLYCKFGKSIGHVPDFRKPFSVAALIVYAIIMLVCCSCGSSRSNLKQETSIESGSNHQRKDTASLSQQTKKTETEDVTEEIEEVTTVYDTSKPIDPATGKSPVLSETTKSTKKGINKKKDESSNTTLNQSSAEQSNDSTKIKDVKEEAKQKQETTIPRQIGGMLWALVALLTLVFVGWLVYRWRQK